MNGRVLLVSLLSCIVTLQAVPDQASSQNSQASSFVGSDTTERNPLLISHKPHDLKESQKSSCFGCYELLLGCWGYYCLCSSPD